jgi:hypothetical protein
MNGFWSFLARCWILWLMVVQGPTIRLDRWIRADMKIVLKDQRGN